MSDEGPRSLQSTRWNQVGRQQHVRLGGNMFFRGGREQSAFRFREFCRSLSPYLPSGRRRVPDILWKTDTIRDRISILAIRPNHLGL